MTFEPNLVQLGQDITALKLYSVSTTALWAYDYLLTVGDEVRYAWKIESVPMFTLFLFIRYLPVSFLVWVNVSSFAPSYTDGICSKTAFIEPVYYTLVTASAQVVLTQRTYAITKKNKWVAGVLYAFTAALVILGFYTAAHIAGGVPMNPLSLYQICLPNTGKDRALGLVSLSLAFDTVVFILVIVQTLLIKSLHRGINFPSILITVSKDAGRYFAVIASSHFLVVVMHSAARSALVGIGMVGNAVFIPMMVTRIIISLKKVATERQPYLGPEVPTEPPTGVHDYYSPNVADIVPLSTLLKDERV